MNVRARSWVFTINNPDEFDLGGCLELADQKKTKYEVLGFEIGDEGTEHIQGYVSFTDAVTRRWLHHFIPRSWNEPARGSAQKNFDYSSKESFVEFGEMPKQGRAKWDKILDAISDPKANPALYMQYRKAYREIVKDDVQDKQRLIYRMPVDQKYPLMRHFKSLDYTICTDKLRFDGENVLLIDHHEIKDQDIEEWSVGFPPKIRYGYEFVLFDPDIVVVLYSDLLKNTSMDIKNLPLYSDVFEI